jgi:hypothetical protein
MNSNYPMIAAAVAAALGTGYANAANPPPPPSLAAAQTQTQASLVIAGSSAAKNAIVAGIENDLCGSAASTLAISSVGGTKNFLAYSCNITSSAVAGVSAGSLVTIYYRTEGGSVVGALPIASNTQIKRLNISDSSCTESSTTSTTAVCTINGTTATNGTNDSWTGATATDTVQLGVTDVEPGQLTANDYPTTYASTAFGHATASQMAGLNTSKLFVQVFGLMVNTKSSPGGFASTTAINLSKESAAGILKGNYTDWAKVPDALTGNPIATVSPTPITVVNREPGSGTRTATNIFFLNYQCGGSASIPGTSGNYATSDELNAANSTGGAIAYASIDNILNPASNSYNNLVLATIDGTTPSTLAAATGRYGFWYEATLVPNSSVTGPSAGLSSFLQTDLPKLATAPSLPDINVIPGVGGNTASLPLVSAAGTASNGQPATSTLAVYVNPFTRGTTSCNVPSESTE